MSDEKPLPPARAGRPAPTCPKCGAAMEFKEGKQVHDLWAERFECGTCGREMYRTYGRGSV
ncbi:MAG: hypothetical protein E6G59_01830 [Actinobacteria bacterium]|nr:MAG: hypothetical protein E6G59_01830 [Actinomycetota bacterium]